MSNYLKGMFIGVLITLWLLFLHSMAHAEFRNQMSLLSTGGLSQADYIDYAQRWGYEWLLGDPWSATKAAAIDAAGLHASFNSNANRAHKWLSFNNPGSASAPQEPTYMNTGGGFEPITDAIYHELEKTACMTENGVTMAYNDLYDPVKGWKYQTYSVNSSVIFMANRYTTEAVNLQVTQNMRSWDKHIALTGNPYLYEGIYFDETGFPTTYAPNCYNPGNPPGAQVGDKNLYDAGRKQFMSGLILAAKAKLGANYGGVSGNVYRVDNYDPEYASIPTFAHSESSGGVACDTMAELEAGTATGCGTQKVSTYGAVPPSQVQLQLAPTNLGLTPQWFEASYRGAQLIAGRGAPYGEWMGWFGQINITMAPIGVQLIRAVPNWDNLVGATERTWDEATDVYVSSNSRIDNNIVYSRHPKTRQLWVVKQSGSPTIKLNKGETLWNAQCVDSLFRPTTDCTSLFTESCGVLSFVPGVADGSGYILTVKEN